MEVLLSIAWAGRPDATGEASSVDPGSAKYVERDFFKGRSPKLSRTGVRGSTAGASGSTEASAGVCG